MDQLFKIYRNITIQFFFILWYLCFLKYSLKNHFQHPPPALLVVCDTMSWKLFRNSGPWINEPTLQPQSCPRPLYLFINILKSTNDTYKCRLHGSIQVSLIVDCVLVVLIHKQVRGQCDIKEQRTNKIGG